MSDINEQMSGDAAISVPCERVKTWRERMEALAPRADGHLRVGIAWASSPESRESLSSRLTDWAPLGAVRGVVFFSLQKGAAAAEHTAAPVSLALIRLEGSMESPDDIAVIENLDLVISVCPIVANLAESQGVPVWIVHPNTENPAVMFKRIADELRQWSRMGDVDICVAQADEQMLQGNPQAAEQRLWQLLGEAPENVGVLNSLGVLLWHDGRTEESLTLLLTALEQDPLHRDTVLNCGDVFQTLGRDEDALALYAHYLQAFSDDVEVRQIQECVAATKVGVTA
ncbi:hypothetical protein CCAX7_31910 [Capsulimonas corticalis]|uniref:Uncharacterized protein n=1 Tax=Capsulimonas corticalis TaxID=2219043 RepID=A0A402D498_9BACT|nr:tetratricopeptide repeat protein [Capsulimonas corticalis]BDI31140.1 hypothetical protein CCAX7_31910 [Capsulimonas corticalis]